jgi:hypothetical protein
LIYHTSDAGKKKVYYCKNVGKRKKKHISMEKNIAYIVWVNKIILYQWNNNIDISDIILLD